MNRPGLDVQNMVICIPLRSIPMTMFHLNSFVNIYADYSRKSISLLTGNFRFHFLGKFQLHLTPSGSINKIGLFNE